MFIYFVEQVWLMHSDPLVSYARRNFKTQDMVDFYWNHYHYGGVRMPASYDSRPHLVEGVDYLDY
jgi:hypothetical protein